MTSRRVTSTLAALLLLGCTHETIGPSPSVTAVMPPAACNQQLVSEIRLTGSGFSPLNDYTLKDRPLLELPQVTLVRTQDLTGMPATGTIVVPNDPTMPERGDITWTSQEAMSFFLCPPGTCSQATPARTDYAEAPAPGLYSIGVANKNGRSTTYGDAIAIVPPPVVDSVTPDLLCGDKDNTVVIRGDWFYQLDGKAIGVTVGQKSYMPALSDCRTLPSPSGVKLEACKTATINISSGTFKTGTHPVVVQGPEPVGCKSTQTVTITFVPEPTLARVEPDVACNAQEERSFTLTGTGFITVDGKLPTVNLNTTKITAASAMGCVDVPGPKEKVQSCTTLTLKVPKAMLPADLYKVTVTNPPPADCTTDPPVNLVIVPPPVVTKVASDLMCNATSPTTFTLTGTGFLGVDAASPKVTLSQNMMTIGMYDAKLVDSTCTQVMGATEMVKTCTSLTVTVPQGTLKMGTYQFTVTNPPPAGCSSQEKAEVQAYPPPKLTNVSPKAICSGGGTFTFTGTSLASGGSATIAGVTTTDTMSSMDGTSAVVNVGGGLMVGGPYDVTWTNPDGCSSTLAGVVVVSLGPVVFFADPPTLWNGIETKVTVYGANVQPPIKSVSIRLGNGQPIALQFTVDQARPNRAVATVPKGTPAGDYDVLITDQSTCGAVLPNGLKIVQQTTLTITKVTPAFGYTGETTAVTINSMGQFIKTPRAYLTAAGGGGQAIALSSVAYADASTLTAVVPKGLGAGSYDLIVVNPDGTVGVKQAAFTISGNPTPVITALDPGVVDTQQNGSFRVVGRNFANNATVTLTCLDQTGMPVTAPAFNTSAPMSCTVDGVLQQCLTVTGTFSTTGVCVVTVTNPADKTSFDFSSLVIQNPALKLGPFSSATAMVTGRRALAVVAAAATPSARFVYAVGGDNGMESGALDTVEATQVDVFGRMGKWFTLPSKMTKKRTLVGAVAIGRFLYAVGGSDGTAALSSVERAAILDPTQVPQITDLDIIPGGGQGLDPGVFYYRVAPVMAMADSFNPGGEGLASDTLVLQAPSLTGKAQITVNWAAFPGAAYYRVYRSPTPNQTAGSEVLVADNVMTTNFIDKGAQPVMVGGQTVVPLPLGATGVWKAVASMATARSGAGVAEVADPAMPQTHYIYALAGNSATEAMATALRSTEYLTVTIGNGGVQTAGNAWQAGPQIASTRWQVGGYTLTANGKAYVWAGSGRNGNLINSAVDGALVGAGGLPGTFAAVSSMGNRAGYGAVGVNNYLFAFGANGGNPDDSGVQAPIFDQSGIIAPQVKNWSSTSVTLRAQRILMGATVQSGFIFVCGGRTDAVPATNTCDTTIW